MEQLTIIACLLVLVALFLVALAVWSPRKFWVKMSALVLGIFLISLGYVSMTRLLGLPRLSTLEWVQSKSKQAVVLGFKIKEGEGVYLLLEVPDFPIPIYYKLKWGRKLAEELQNADREVRRRGGKLMFKFPSEKSWDDREQKFYPLPHPAPPPKDNGGSTVPEVFNPPAREF